MWDFYRALENFFGGNSSDEIIIKKNGAKAETNQKNTNETSKTTNTTNNHTFSKTATEEVVKTAEETTHKIAVDDPVKYLSEGIKKSKEVILKGLKSTEPEIEEESLNQVEKVSVSLISKLRGMFGHAAGNDAIQKEVGMLIPKGIAGGFEKNSKEAIEAFEDLLTTLEYQRSMDIISEEEYYAALEDLRDQYFEKGSERWLYYTSQIYSYQKEFLEQEKKRYEETYDEIFEYASDKIDAVIKKQSTYQEKLQSYGRIFQKNTILLDDGNIEFYSLGNLKKENAELERYISLMADAKSFVKNSGLSDEAVEELLKDINELPVHSASYALEKLMTSPLSKDWLSEYEKRVELSKSGSTAYYEDEFYEAVDESTIYMKEKLSEAGFEIPETFFDAGKDAAARFGEGFSVELSEELEKIKSQIAQFSSNIEVSVAKSDSTDTIKTGDEINTTNYYITAATNEDVTDTIQRYETIKRLGGY